MKDETKHPNLTLKACGCPSQFLSHASRPLITSNPSHILPAVVLRAPSLPRVAVIPQSMQLKLHAAAQVKQLKLYAVAEATESNSSANVPSPTLPKCSTIWT